VVAVIGPWTDVTITPTTGVYARHPPKNITATDRDMTCVRRRNISFSSSW
jgi:hypothetical protein